MQITTSLVAAALLLGQSSSELPSDSSGYATIERARVFLIDDIQVPAEQAGVLRLLQLEDGTPVQEGLEVKMGTLLGKLDDKDAAARRRAAILDHQVAQAEEGKSKVAIEAADKTAEVAHAEYMESADVNRRVPNAIPQTQIRRQQLTEERALAEAKVARSDSKTAGLTVQLRDAQVEVADLNLQRHEFRSPLDGEIVQLLVKVGEWVNPGDPIMRIVRLDKLRVEGYLQLSQYDRAAVINQPVTVEIQLQERTFEFRGTITYVSPLIDSSGEYRVWCEIDNERLDDQWVMLPGLEADMRIRVKRQHLTSSR